MAIDVSLTKIGNTSVQNAQTAIKNPILIQKYQNNDSETLEKDLKISQKNENLEKDLKIFEEGLEKLKKVVHSDMKLEVNKDADRIVVKIIDKDNGEVIRQIPPEEIVNLIKNMNEFLGVFLDQKI